MVGVISWEVKRLVKRANHTRSVNEKGPEGHRGGIRD